MRLDRAQRWLLGSIGAGLLGLLAVCLVLQPEQKGYGTHQQLGLPECTYRALFGHNCPSCGMTTSWTYLVRGEIGRSAATNVGGTLLGMLAIIAAPWALLTAARGRPWLLWPSTTLVVSIATAVAAVTLIQWGLRWPG